MEGRFLLLFMALLIGLLVGYAASMPFQTKTAVIMTAIAAIGMQVMISAAMNALGINSASEYYTQWYLTRIVVMVGSIAGFFLRRFGTAAGM